MACLKACDELQKSVRLEIILSFDKKASLKSLKEITAQYPHFRILFSPQAGASYARNHGLRSIAGDYFILIDDDCLVGDRKWLENLIKLCQEESLYGGHYKLIGRSSYWAKVYNWVNDCWLSFGGSHQGSHCEHLLGGFIFGHRSVADRIEFNPELQWGGEEKELIRRLNSEYKISAHLVDDLWISHEDQSGFSNLLRRAVLQGYAAGAFGLQSTRQRKIIPVSWNLIPGLSLFYIFSRVGIGFGLLAKKTGRVRIPSTSPIA